MGALLIVILVGGVYAFAHRGSEATLEVPTSSTTTTSTAAATSTTPGAAGVSAVNSRPDIPMPDLTRPYTPPQNLPAAIQAQSAKEVAQEIAQLKIDPNHEAYWLMLGVYRKGSADYTGAEAIWLYCVARWPKDTTAYNNLADMYQNYTHQYDKAAQYWNKLIAVDSSYIPAYINLVTLYNIDLHDSAQAAATIKEGLKNNPGDPDLLHLQTELGL